MIWMFLFWVFFVLTLISGIFAFFGRNLERDTRDKSYDFYFLGLIIMGLSLMMSIATKDPFLEFLPIFNAIKESGWEVGLSVVIFGITLFGSWIYLKREYLKPLRNDVNVLKEETGRIDERTKNIQTDVSWIKDNCKISFKK